MIYRDVDLTKKLDYSSGVALLGYSLILAIVRTFNVKDEAGRIMVAAPLIAFVTTHILYLNFYQLDYGVCLLNLHLHPVEITIHPESWFMLVYVHRDESFEYFELIRA